VFENQKNMKHPQSIEYDRYYHIYNRGINGETLFRETSNYEHFVRLMDLHLSPVVEIYSWVLMKNHFHFLVRILSLEEIGFIEPKEDQKNINYPKKKKYNPTQQFGNLFNAYAKAYNLKYERTGSLFESPFRRIRVDDERYFKQLIFYIHNNPVRHGFCATMSDYPWSSYLSILSLKRTKLQRDKVIGWFNTASEFIEFHRQPQNMKTIESMIIDE